LGKVIHGPQTNLRVFGTGLFCLAVSVLPIRSGCFGLSRYGLSRFGLADSVWPFRSQDISVRL